MQLIQVQNREYARAFIQVNVDILCGIPGYIRPLDKDIDEVFDIKKNKAFRHGEAARWILRDEDGHNLGRIAAFVNKRYKTKGDEFPVGGIGFFECINNQEAADRLFDVARHWLLQKGMGAMDGPINFGERDKWWGLVTEGFHEPLYQMNFNPPYYQALFENYGFKTFFEQICFGMDPKKPFSKKLMDRHAIIAADPAYRAAHIDIKKLDLYAAYFTEVYNKAWASHGGMKQLKLDQVKQLFRKMKPFMEERLIWFTYHNDKPIALFANIPDLNQWFKYLNGRFGLLQKLKFLWLVKTKKNKKFTGLAFGVIPEYQGKGIDSYLIAETGKMVLILPYTEYEMQWVGDFNPKMINLIRHMADTYPSRKLKTYRYIFDRTIEFKRHPVF
jgi:GNAT superfamily N-acetyltransferase